MRWAFLIESVGAVDAIVATKTGRSNVGSKEAKREKEPAWKAGFLPRVPLT